MYNLKYFIIILNGILFFLLCNTIFAYSCDNGDYEEIAKQSYDIKVIEVLSVEELPTSFYEDREQYYLKYNLKESIRGFHKIGAHEKIITLKPKKKVVTNSSGVLIFDEIINMKPSNSILTTGTYIVFDNIFYYNPCGSTIKISEDYLSDINYQKVKEGSKDYKRLLVRILTRSFLLLPLYGIFFFIYSWVHDHKKYYMLLLVWTLLGIVLFILGNILLFILQGF